MSAAAALAAWLGGSVIVLADARRGLALGLALVAAAFAALAWVDGQTPGAIAMLAGGGVAAALRLRSGPGGWGLMEPGSTPRIILTVVAGLVSLWIAASVPTGGGGALRFSVLVTLGLMGARALQGGDRAVILSAAAGLALALGAAAGIAANGPGLAPYVIVAVIAAGLSALPTAEHHGT